MDRCWSHVIWLSVVLIGMQLASASLCPCASCAVASKGKCSDCSRQWACSIVLLKVVESEGQRRVADDSPCLVSSDLLDDAFLHFPRRVIGGQAVARSVQEPLTLLCRFLL